MSVDDYRTYLLAGADQEIAMCDETIDGVIEILREMQAEGHSDIDMQTTAMASLMRVMIERGHGGMVTTFVVPLIGRMYVRLMKAGEDAGKTQV